MPVLHSKDKSSPRERKDKRHLVRRGANNLQERNFAADYLAAKRKVQRGDPDIIPSAVNQPVNSFPAFSGTRPEHQAIRPKANLHLHRQNV